MREIKFRVWDKGVKVMVIPRSFVNNQKSESDNFVLMQYTGLKDNNGKDIYEGDIVKQSDDVGREVLFHEGCWMLKDHFALYDYDIENIEVIGNIYEHSHLLDNN